MAERKVKKVKATKPVKGKAKVNVRVKKISKTTTKAPAKTKIKTTKAATKVASKPVVKVTAKKDKQTRVEIMQEIAEQASLTRVQVETVFDSLHGLIESHMRKRGSGEFTIPKTGIKIRRVRKKASKARKMVSPLTGQEVTIAAKPARQSIKVSALKILKEMVDK